jgi:hypothetical protein
VTGGGGKLKRRNAAFTPAAGIAGIAGKNRRARETGRGPVTV